MNILSIGEKIKKKRKELGMTLKELAGSKVTTGQISLIECHKSKPSIELLEYLAEKLDTSVEYLLESEIKQAKKMCTYFENLAFCSIFNKDYLKVQACIEDMLIISEKYNLDENKYRVYFIRGRYFYEIGNYEESSLNFIIANYGFIEKNMKKYIIESLIYLSCISLKQKNYISSIIHLKSILNSFSNDKNVLSYRVYYLLFKSYLGLFDYDKTSYYLNKLIYFLEKESDIRNNALKLLDKAKNSMENEDIDNAVKFSERSKEVFENIICINEMVDIQIDIINYFIENKEYDKAKNYLYNLEKYNFNNNLDKINKVYTNSSYSESKQDKIYNESFNFNIFGNYGYTNFNEIVEFDLNKYIYFISSKNFKDAEFNLIGAYRYFKENREYRNFNKMCLILAKFYLDNGKIEESNTMLKEALFYYQN